MKNKTIKELLNNNWEILLLFFTLILTVFGFFMIISADMGESSANIDIVSSDSLKQLAIFGISLFLFFIVLVIKWEKINRKILWILYMLMFFVLLWPRMYSPVGGAYAWIRIAGLSLQPSEFAKVFIIYFGARLLTNKNDKDIRNTYFKYWIAVAVYAMVIIFIQHDTGSGLVLLAIAYVISLIPPNKEIRKYQTYLTLFGIGGLVLIFILLTKQGTDLLKKFDNNYMINRFLASANPFEYQYDAGYHLVMSLVSFSTGGLTGVGYTNSIHKYMNFPNPSNDFILPVIVEEMGVLFGLLPIIILYGSIIGLLIHYSKKANSIETKIVLAGVYTYLIVHFILNAGGVSGLIPLTGVPLLLISSGGSSTMAFYCAIAFVIYEIRKNKKEVFNENNRREI